MTALALLVLLDPMPIINNGSVGTQVVREEVLSVSFHLPITKELYDLADVPSPTAVEYFPLALDL